MNHTKGLLTAASCLIKFVPFEEAANCSLTDIDLEVMSH
jgi:hypothetical protein